MTQSPTPPPPPSPPDVAGVRPHRGPLILVFGILSIVCCFLFGIAAWVMGNNDLQAMQAGQMDRSGESLTKAGKICGIVGIALAILGILLQILFIILGVGVSLIPGMNPGGTP